MPELPEVQTIVTTLQAKLPGKQIRAVEVARADIIRPPGIHLPSLLKGQRINAISRRGKKIIFSLDSAERFYIHLGMSGRLTVEPPDAPLLPHTHLILVIDKFHVRFRDPRRFGGVWWLGRDLLPDAGMGPEPLSLRPSQLAHRLARTSRAVKNALLDQSVIAGLGNIYVDESLFAAAIHPLTPANTLTASRIASLNRAIKQTLRRALKHKGSTLRDYRDADGASGRFQRLHRVYGREGKPCKNCGSPIQRITLGGRSTHFCPACQKPAG